MRIRNQIKNFKSCEYIETVNIDQFIADMNQTLEWQVTSEKALREKAMKYREHFCSNGMRSAMQFINVDLKQSD